MAGKKTYDDPRIAELQRSYDVERAKAQRAGLKSNKPSVRRFAEESALKPHQKRNLKRMLTDSGNRIHRDKLSHNERSHLLGRGATYDGDHIVVGRKKAASAPAAKKKGGSSVRVSRSDPHSAVRIAIGAANTKTGRATIARLKSSSSSAPDTLSKSEKIETHAWLASSGARSLRVDRKEFPTDSRYAHRSATVRDSVKELNKLTGRKSAAAGMRVHQPKITDARQIRRAKGANGPGFPKRQAGGAVAGSGLSLTHEKKAQAAKGPAYTNQFKARESSLGSNLKKLNKLTGRTVSSAGNATSGLGARARALTPTTPAKPAADPRSPAQDAKANQVGTTPKPLQKRTAPKQRPAPKDPMRAGAMHGRHLAHAAATGKDLHSARKAMQKATGGLQKEKAPLGPIMRGKKGGAFRIGGTGKKIYIKK